MASITGRMTNFTSKHLPALGRMGTQRQVGSERWAVSVRELDDGPERDECWDLLVAAYPDFATYRELTDRRLPVAVLERRAG